MSEAPEMDSVEKSSVAVVKGTKIEEMVEESLSLLGGISSIVHVGDRVLLKPNLTGGLPSGTGATVDLKILEKMAEIVQEAGAREIIIAEDCGVPIDTSKVFVKLGVTELAEKVGAKLVDLTKHGTVEVKVEKPCMWGRVNIYDLAIECDKLISISTLKTHHQAGISLSLKNMFGLVPREQRLKFHVSGMDEGIVDVNCVRKPDLSLVDGTVGMEGVGPVWGNPVRMNLLVSGRDPVAVDSVCARIMGYEPSHILYLKWAGDKNLGKCDLNLIEVKGKPVDEVARSFLSALDVAKVKLKDKIRIVEDGACSACCARLATALWFVHWATIEDNLTIDNEVYIGTKDQIPEKYEEKTILIGDCIKHKKHLGRFIPGCPPSFQDIAEAFGASTGQKARMYPYKLPPTWVRTYSSPHPQK